MNLSFVPARLRAWVCSSLVNSFRRESTRLRSEDFATMRFSFSQFGEDLVVAEHLVNLRRPARGIYIDAGCFDPFRFSNTRLLNLLGWRGLNVDASPEVIERFRAARPGDVSVCAALAETSGQNEFLETAGGASSRLAQGAVPLRAEAIQARRPVTTCSLREVFGACALAGEAVDLLDIDCEGADFAVLRGFGIERCRPVLICIEAHSEGEEEELRDYLARQGYGFICRRGPTILFRDGEVTGIT